MTTREKVTALRRLMRREGFSAYVIPSTDPHISEYVPECWKRRGWLTGFTGSVGDVVVTMRNAGLWVDSRYFLEAESVLDPKVFRLFKKGVKGTPTIEAYLAAQLKRGQSVGMDPRVLSKSWGEKLSSALGEKGILLRLRSRNLVDLIWEDRPARPTAPVERYSERWAGESVPSKLARLRKDLAGQRVDAHVVASLDSIAWLFNIRGTDVQFNPVVIAYAIVTRRGAALYLDLAKIDGKVRQSLRATTRLLPYEAVGDALRRLGKGGKRVLIDPDTTNRWVLDRLKGAQVTFAPSPVVAAKAVKNAVEARGMRAAHVRDGVALVRFLHWLEGAIERERLTEWDCVERLEAFRAEERHFRGISFDTIVGFGGNGAVIHYRPRPGTSARLRKRGILLMDTGGQYLDGTTDVTRTITLGQPTRREKEFFTRVLKGHISLSRTPFPKGTKGVNLEVLARQGLWVAGLNYMHGTGHGVGHYLNVHEGPVGFGPSGTAPMEPGNVISVEPGHYVAGRYGFRTENLVLVVRDQERSTKEQEWCVMEPLTLCPIDLRLVEPKLLLPDEIAWLNDYHQRVRRTLTPRLEPAVKSWLRRATRPL